MKYENETIKNQLEHRTIRAFTDDKVPEELFKVLIDVAQRTPTSSGMQASSIIRVTDQNLKNEIATICKQEYVAQAAELLIFIVDNFRNHRIALEKGSVDEGGMEMNRFFAAYQDACLTAQNVVVAAESFGLGTVYLGSILNDIPRLCELLKLPELTFPVLGLGIGYPNQNPNLKPRMDMSLRVFENQYQVFDNYLEKIKNYDEKMQTYYDLRNANRRVDKFSDQVVRYLKGAPTRKYLLKEIKKQGFNTTVEE